MLLHCFLPVSLYISETISTIIIYHYKSLSHLPQKYIMFKKRLWDSWHMANCTREATKQFLIWTSTIYAPEVVDRNSYKKSTGGMRNDEREETRYDREISHPPVISALFIMPSLVSPMSLNVWHWYGSTLLWHQLLLGLVITLLKISYTHSSRGCLHTLSRQAPAPSLRLWWWVWRLRSVASLSPQFLLIHQHPPFTR